MSIVYQYDANGYFVGQCDDYGDGMPHNCTDVKPVEKQGFIPYYNNGKWEQVENHKGLEGYLNGQPHTIKDYGPLPEGWSDTPPEPTAEEKAEQIRNQRNALISETDYLMMPDYQLDDEKRNDFKDYRQALRDITKQTSFPESVEWPDKPTMEKNMTNR